MKGNHYSNVAVTLLSFILGGCTASFEPRLSSLEMTKDRLPTVRKVQAGVEVSVEEFFSPHKSRRAFDADIGSYGVLPLLVRVESKGTETYKIQNHQIRAFLDGEQLKPLYAHEAASQGASRDYVWNSLVNTAAMGPLAMYFSVAGLALSAQQAKSINKKVEHHFESLELQDSPLKPDGVATGFVYFYLPSAMKRLENLTLEVSLESDGPEGETPKNIFYRLPFPIVEAH